MLAGCQSKPGVAAYVGNTEISVDQVNKIVSDLDDAVQQRQGSIPDTAYGNVREQVLGDLVFVEVAHRYADAQSFSQPPINVDDVAQQTGLPTSLGFVTLEAQADAYHNMLLSRVTASTPTDADLHDVYNRAPHVQESFDQVKSQLQALQGLPAALGLRRDLQKALNDDHVVVNPRYRGIEIPLYSVRTGDGSTFTAVALTLGTASADNSDFVSSVS
jgi:hypothetical protein